MNLPTIPSLTRSVIFATGFVFQWAMALAVVGVFALGFMFFGVKLERASENYAQAERMQTMKALYESVDWSTKVENEYRQRLDAEKRLERLCKKTRSKVCL